MVLTADFISSDTTICWGTCITFTDISTGTVTAWAWTFEGAITTTSSVKNPINVCYPAAGTYSVKLIITNGVSFDSVIKYINVVTPFISAGANATITLGSSIVLNGSGPVITYSWSPSTALNFTNIPNPTASPTITTTYTVSGKDTNNCVASSAVTILVIEPELPCGDVFVPTGFSPNGDGENDKICVMGNCIAELDFSIYDRLGEKIFETKDGSRCWNGEFHGKTMANDVFVYYLVVTLKNGDKVTKKGNIQLVN